MAARYKLLAGAGAILLGAGLLVRFSEYSPPAAPAAMSVTHSPSFSNWSMLAPAQMNEPAFTGRDDKENLAVSAPPISLQDVLANPTRFDARLVLYAVRNANGVSEADGQRTLEPLLQSNEADENTTLAITKRLLEGRRDISYLSWLADRVAQNRARADESVPAQTLREEALRYIVSETARSDPAIALQLAENALHEFPESVELQRARAYAMQDLGDSEAALGVLQQALLAYDQRPGATPAFSADPVREELVAQTAAALVLMGRLEQASPLIGWLEKIESSLLSTIPDHVPAK